MADKTRLDVYLTENGFAESRQKAQALIMSGCVYVNNQKSDKAGNTVKKDDVVEVRGDKLKYVSRGGLKLEKAMINFGITLDEKVCSDIGASTGGFTDCMLQNGAAKVYAVDVGYGQLAWKLRTDERVINLERTNFRYCTSNEIPDLLDFASVDVSFISLKIILPVLYNLLKTDAECICLIKPQFEAGKEFVGKNGVVRDNKIHISVINNVIQYALNNNFKVLNLDFSPIKGPKGNIEYLIHLKKVLSDPDVASEIDPQKVVELSHSELDKIEV